MTECVRALRVLTELPQSVRAATRCRDAGWPTHEGPQRLSDTQLEKLNALVPSLMVLRDAAAAAQMAYSVDIVGRADAPGSSEFNLRLSQSRAEAVHRYLLAHGAPAKLMHVRGIGAIDAVGPQANEADDTQRRVNFELIDAPVETADPTP